MPPIALSMPDWPVLLCISLVLLYIPVHYLIVYPYYLSPLRHVPGPSALTWSLKTLLVGNFPEIILGEAGIPQRAWVKKYGPVVRAIGPVGIERLIFCRPEALHKILASDWTEYPRVRVFSTFIAGWIHIADFGRIAWLHAGSSGSCSWLWVVDSHWERA